MKAQMAMATLPVSDLSRARSFYEDTLGLEVRMADEEMGAVVYRVGDSNIFVYTTQATSGTATSVSIWLEDLDAVAADLRGKGVRFEEFDMPGASWRDGVASMSTQAYGDVRNAWLKDPDGNIIALGEGRQLP